MRIDSDTESASAEETYITGSSAESPPRSDADSSSVNRSDQTPERTTRPLLRRADLRVRRSSNNVNEIGAVPDCYSESRDEDVLDDLPLFDAFRGYACSMLGRVCPGSRADGNDEEAAEVARKKKEAEIAKEKKDAIAKERKASIAKGKRAAERAAVRQREKANPGGQGELEAEPKQP
ncbi:unnamed protein product [Microthlaspi erraticum]|uniref:Uncharacterized protein n=1 Tax=Microthlaspi erraticum TaxID=1685480 RepID=A0A6D2IIV5_9BRAS|nr:unnamed protein product [Microthlaspi erraticum]